MLSKQNLHYWIDVRVLHVARHLFPLATVPHTVLALSLTFYRLLSEARPLIAAMPVFTAVVKVARSLITGEEELTPVVLRELDEVERSCASRSCVSLRIFVEPALLLVLVVILREVVAGPAALLLVEVALAVAVAVAVLRLLLLGDGSSVMLRQLDVPIESSSSS